MLALGLFELAPKIPSNCLGEIQGIMHSRRRVIFRLGGGLFLSVRRYGFAACAFKTRDPPAPVYLPTLLPAPKKNAS
jgi:hypothetical protein